MQQNWEAFKTHLKVTMEKSVPSKRPRSRDSPLWFTPSIKHIVNHKQRAYNKAKRSGKEEDWLSYNILQKEVHRALRKGRWTYVDNILTENLTNRNPKPFWQYIKSQKQENLGVVPLKSNRKLLSTSKEKAEILNNQFQSVFTKEDTTPVPTPGGAPSPRIDSLEINTPGVEKLLRDLNPNKAGGPDNIPFRLLKELAAELAPILTAIFKQSLEEGRITDD